MSRRWIARLAALLVVPALFVGLGAAENATVSVGGSASADGELALLFKPDQGDEQTIKITILKGTGYKEAAREIRKELILALGDDYDVELKGKEKRNVTIAAKTSAHAFILELANNTVGGLSVSVGS